MNGKRKKAGLNGRRLIERFARSDANLVDVLRSAGLAVLLRVVGAGCAFFLNVAIGRLLGAEGAGLYFLALSVASIGAVAGRLGMEHTMLRFVAGEAAKENWSRVKGAFAMGTRLAGGVSLALSCVVLGIAPWISRLIFDEPALTAPLRWISLSIFTFALMMLVSESLKGLRRVREAMLVSGVLYPVAALLLVWPLTKALGVSGAALAYVLGTGAAAFFGYLVWHRATGPYAEYPSEFEYSTLWNSASKLWVMSLINSALLPWAPLLLLGIWGSAEDSGVFGVATRIAMLATLLMTTVNTVAAPRFSKLHSDGDMPGLKHLACRFALVLTLATSPIFLLMIFGADWLMSFFGPEFIRGGIALTIIALGQLINTMVGTVGYLLIISGHERDIRNGSIGSAVVMTLCAVFLIPILGVVGAAIANAGAVVTMSMINSVFVYKRLGFVVVPR